MDIQERAEVHLRSILLESEMFEIYSFQEDIIKAMIEFAKEMCEKQKEACANNAYQYGNESGVIIEKAVMNTKNVIE